MWYGRGDPLTVTTTLGVFTSEAISGTYYLSVLALPGETLSMTTGTRVFHDDFRSGEVTEMNQWAIWEESKHYDASE